MSRNSFQELEHMHEERYRQRARDTKKKLTSSIRIFQFIGDIVELFLPKAFHVFVKASGGEVDYPAGPSAPEQDYENPNPKYPNTKS